MAKTATITENGPGDAKSAAVVGSMTGNVERFRGFLGDVRAEMRKVVTPSRKEVQITTIVVLAVVFFFAAYFYVVDSVFSYGLKQLMDRLVGS